MTKSDQCLIAARELGFMATEEGFILSPTGNNVTITTHKKTGYKYFSARGVYIPVSVHRFVAYQVFGEIALQAECVRHLNGNRADSSFSNIAYGTYSQNQFDIPFEKRSKMGIARNRLKRRFSAEQIIEIRKRISLGISLNKIRNEFGGSIGIYANIRDGVSYFDVL